MENRVGDVMLSDAELSKLLGEIAALHKKLEKYGVALTTEERQKAVKFRSGGDGIVALVGKLLEDHGVTLPNVTRDAMAADVALARKFETLRAALGSLMQLVDDTILEAESEAWWGATAGYTALERMSGGSARLEADLKPVVEFFRIGRRKVKVVAGGGTSGGGGTP